LSQRTAELFSAAGAASLLAARAGSETPAVPIVLGAKERVYHFWRALLEKGVFTVMSIAPAVPPGKDLIRTAISARHTDEQLERIAEAMAYAIKRS
jgi:7-keto-8-aminopelargonate synthetase-like enzyme